MAKRYAAAAAIGVGFVAAAVAMAAQGQDTFKARLSAVASDARTRPQLAGSGSVTGVLKGSTLTVTGSFEGLVSPVTIAQIHKGVATGVRGPVVFDLTASKATSGTIQGSFDLTPDQIESLKKGQFYVQIHSEKTPDGTLWGWLLH